jgi:hypothetical protein
MLRVEQREPLEGVAVEVDAGAASAISARSMVEGSCPCLRDEHEDLTCKLARVAAMEVERGDRPLEEPEAAFDMGLVLRSKGSRTHPERHLTERGVDLGCVVAGPVVEEQREGRFARRHASVFEGVGDGGAVRRRRRSRRRRAVLAHPASVQAGASVAACRARRGSAR